MIIHKSKITLYHKYATAIILVGILPSLIAVSVILNSIVLKYQKATLYRYTQAANYVTADVTSLIDSYNTISKLPYYYNFSTDEKAANNSYSFDSFRKVIYGEIYEEANMEIERKRDMDSFLNYIASIDSDIIATHFLFDDNGETIGFHYTNHSPYLDSEPLFLKYMNYSEWDRQSTSLIIIPTHQSDYFANCKYDTITLARNYFDLRGPVGNESYVGTLFIDIKLSSIEKLFRQARLDESEQCYLLDKNGYCLYSNVEEVIGKEYSDLLIEEQKNNSNLFPIVSEKDDFGISVYIFMDNEIVYGNIHDIYRMIMVLLIGMAAIVLCGSVLASKRITKPIYDIMSQMEQIETGNFDIKLEVGGNDEIGILSQRFNQMSQALKQYINQSYLAKIKMNEAELTALKSQIYPHFLYNTLEIIRMTSLEEGDEKVGKMIEALSEQIHYLIGPMQDVVPLNKEIDIVQKYIYLLNCRYAGKIQLLENCRKREDVMVPKLILQPVVENAYVHGLKPKNGSGTIMIETVKKEENLEITVMDNGVGMTEEELEKIYMLLNSDEPGVKNEYNWQSIGIKNVNDRIRHLYGEDYGLEITSTSGVGTSVKIMIPLKLRNSGEECYGEIDFG
ncbi:MAG: sensor histidine kinase [Acetatifactor sp.]|nr:sensor histidine kinase [Acetatifactor sp.]